MKLTFGKIFIIILILGIIVLGSLLWTGKIWFVYPNKNIYQIYGLDISHHQGEIDWNIVDSKFEFVFAKATEGSTFIDKRFYENVEGIRNSGRIVGAYHFYHFPTNGIDQASHFIDVVGNIIDLPPVIDFEFGGNSIDFVEETVMAELQICINAMEEYYGSEVILYVTHQAYKLIKRYNIQNPIWYRSIIFPINNNEQNILFWQYHNSARVEGINTIVDLNVFKGGIEALRKLIMN